MDFLPFEVHNSVPVCLFSPFDGPSSDSVWSEGRLESRSEPRAAHSVYSVLLGFRQQNLLKITEVDPELTEDDC